MLINSCPNDTQFTDKHIHDADAILGGGKFAPGYERKHWEGAYHGFAVRGDMGEFKVAAAKEGAFKAIVELFLAKL